MPNFLRWIIVIAALSVWAAASDDVTQELRARDQALLDAIAPGDVQAWDAALAKDAVYVDENGDIFDRADFLAQLKPLPAGSSGKITISSYSARVRETWPPSCTATMSGKSSMASISPLDI